MQFDYTIVVPVIALLATCVGGLIWIIKFMFNKLTPAIDKLTKATESNTTATKSADIYLRDRNGRDSEVHKLLIVTTAKSHKETLTAIKHLTDTVVSASKNQHIDTQDVKVQTVGKVK